MIVNLYLYSWSGISLGATHIYAELQPPGGNYVELKATLTARQAAALNKKRDALAPSHGLYKAGEQYEGFDTREAATQAGIKQWLTHCPSGTFLVLGNVSHCEPKPLLATSFLPPDEEAELKAQVQDIINKCEAIGWHDDPKNDDLMDRFYNNWRNLMRSWPQPTNFPNHEAEAG